MQSKRFPKDPNGVQNFGMLIIAIVGIAAAGAGTFIGISIGKKKKG